MEEDWNEEKYFDAREYWDLTLAALDARDNSDEEIAAFENAMEDWIAGQ